MCGITGWVDWERDLTQQGDIIAAMTERLAARGPDASGIWLSPRAAIGHRRLIVVDPEGGGQPMVRRQGGSTFVITYNGELYNAAELRRELSTFGYGFQTRSDTEVLLVSFIAWGPECVQRLNGIFAFGVWDERQQRLFLARDRLGVKPLFYARKGSAFLFGSEPKALLAHPLVQPEIDEEGLMEVFFLAPSRTPGHGVYRGIAELRPGHYLIHDRRGTSCRRYWQLRSQPHTEDLTTTVRHVRELLEDAVLRQLVSDVPVCTLLSGGLDSSAVTALAASAYAREGRGPLMSFSVDFLDNDRHFQSDRFYPDADGPWVRRIASFLGTDHHNVVLDALDQVEHLDTAMQARDLPGYADIDASLYLFCREVKKRATVALSGEAADEVFGGYPWFHDPGPSRVGATFPWVRMVSERLELLAPELRARLRPEAYLQQRYRETLEEVPRLEGEKPGDARVRELFYLNLTWFLTALLDRKDRMSMAVGLEVRVPFCDHRLVEYVWNIPWSMKCCDGRAKGLLRRAAAGLLPDDALARRKSPYPKTHSPLYLEAVRSRLLRVLDDPSSPLRALVDAPALRELARSAVPGRGPTWFGQTMGMPQFFAYLLQVDGWLRQYRVSLRLS